MNYPNKRTNTKNGIYLSIYSSPSTNAEAAAKELAELRESVRLFTLAKSVKQCGKKLTVVKTTGGKREPKEITYFCKNKHVCPVCMSYAYSQLGKKLTKLLDNWMDSRGSVYTQTFTLPNRPKSLAYKYKDIVSTWGYMVGTKAFQQLKKEFGLSQYFRVTEEVLDGKNSFPHFHLTWFFGSHLNSHQMADFCQQVAALWALAANRQGIRGTQSIQQWSGPVRFGNQSYVRYLTKHGYLELSFTPEDWLRNSGRLKPLDFLRVFVKTGDSSMYDTWVDYERATSGKQRFRASSQFDWLPEPKKVS